MQCPVCVTKRIYARVLEPDLSVSACETCEGIWISHANYMIWRVGQSGDVPEHAPKTTLQVEDVSKAKMCPQCNRLLLRYQVGHGTSVVVDHCGACGGMWLDRGEWAVMKEHGLHDNLFHVLTAAWQSDIRHAAMRAKVDKIYEARLGAETFAKVKGFRDWMEGRTEKALIANYIADAVRNGGKG